MVDATFTVRAADHRRDLIGHQSGRCDGSLGLVLDWLGDRADQHIPNQPFPFVRPAVVYTHWQGKPIEHPPFQNATVHKFVRHPIYFGFLLAFCATPVMTVGHLLFSIATTGYIFIGILLQERDLITFHGDAYIEYREHVSMIVQCRRKGTERGPTRRRAVC